MKTATKEKLLAKIGLEPMRNMDVLLDDLAELTPADFDRLILSGQQTLADLLDKMRCEDCEAAHGGQCPKPFDDTCAIDMADWLGMPAKRECILSELDDHTERPGRTA